MDTGIGRMKVFLEDKEALEEAAQAQELSGRVHSIFKVGEQIKIKESSFKIISIGDKFMRLQILPFDLTEEA